MLQKTSRIRIEHGARALAIRRLPVESMNNLCGSKNMVSEPSASPRSFTDMQILSPCARGKKSETLEGWGQWLKQFVLY